MTENTTSAWHRRVQRYFPSVNMAQLTRINQQMLEAILVDQQEFPRLSKSPQSLNGLLALAKHSTVPSIGQLPDGKLVLTLPYQDGAIGYTLDARLQVSSHLIAWGHWLHPDGTVDHIELGRPTWIPTLMLWQLADDVVQKDYAVYTQSRLSGDN